MYHKIEKIYRQRLLAKTPTLKANDIQLRYILKYLPKNKNIKILDAGCGNGNYAFYLSNLGYTDISAVDLFADIDTDTFVYCQSSIDRLPFADKTFDFIYSNSVIYYLDKPEKGIKKFNRVLKNGGVLFFTAHTKYSLFTLWRVFKRDILKSKNMEHLQNVKFYSAKYYRDIVGRNGFELILQIGYKPSFILYPLYYKFTKFFDKIFNIKLALVKNRIETSNSVIKSELSYHSVFVVRKIND